ncbi:putative porin [Candidatus Fermentibacteria bacterium]|nr:putative porin [Candidatus Fermentibacteria bacterium]
MRRHLAAIVSGLLLVCGVAHAAEGGAWSDKLKLGGDFRYRLETISDDSKTDADGDTYTQMRHRIRTRLYLDAAVSDALSFRLSLATGGTTDPVSTNQTLDGDFANKGVAIDMAYADVHPASLKGLSILLGKMKTPFVAPGKSELLWDGDLTPEGLALRFSSPVGSAKLFANAGYLWVDEIKDDSDVMLMGGQAGLSAKLGTLDLTAGLGYFTYTEVELYNIMQVMAQIGTKLGTMPASLFVDFASNGEADDDNTGMVFGMGLGKKKAPGSWDLMAYYQSLEANAVNPAFCGSDFGGGGTDASGVVVSAGLQVMKDADLGLTYFLNKRGIGEGGAETDYGRMQLDFAFKF